MVVLYRLETRCKCGRTLPVRISRVVVEATKGLPEETVIATYACRSCGVVEIQRRQVIDRRAA